MPLNKIQRNYLGRGTLQIKLQRKYLGRATPLNKITKKTFGAWHAPK